MENTTLTFRQKIHETIDLAENKIGKIFNWLIIILIITSIISLPFEFLTTLIKYKKIVISLEIFTVGFFTFEYFLRIYVAPQRLKYIFSFSGLIDFIAIAPFYLNFLDLRVLRILRLARLIRILKIANLQAIRYKQGEIKVRHQKDFMPLPNEKIEQVAQKHPLFFLLSLLPPLFFSTLGLTIYVIFTSEMTFAFLVAMLIFALIFLIKAWLDYAYDVIYITNHRIILQNHHIFGKQTNEVYYEHITNVKAQNVGILPYFLGYGSLIIETAAQPLGEIQLKYIIDHDNLAQHINFKKGQFSKKESL